MDERFPRVKLLNLRGTISETWQEEKTWGWHWIRLHYHRWPERRGKCWWFETSFPDQNSGCKVWLNWLKSQEYKSWVKQFRWPTIDTFCALLGTRRKIDAETFLTEMDLRWESERVREWDSERESESGFYDFQIFPFLVSHWWMTEWCYLWASFEDHD